MHGLHEGYPVHDEPIEIFLDHNRTIVSAKHALDPGSVMLPPCIPRQSRVHEKTDHPHAVKIVQKTVRQTTGEVKSDSAKVLRSREFFLTPEFKAPGRDTARTAVADEPDAGVSWKWSAVGEETMHPFWAVRRMTASQLTQAKLQTPSGQLVPRFNCELKVVPLSAVNIAAVGGKVLNRTRLHDVPFLTNNVSLARGEELILEVPEKRAKSSAGSKRASSREIMNLEKKAKPEKRPNNWPTRGGLGGRGF